ncbi:MAG: hypothetical protein DRI24_21770 [Deltaproteobacteria bacterium]|nr:MAG: hypothetical protein DRI24_21770 [Deltaproteobacteria bacterium]
MTISVVIGAGTTVDFGNQNACIISANWGFNPGRADAFCLGSFESNPEYVLYKPTQTLSLTGYAPVQSSFTIPPSVDCDDASTINASVSPATCEETISSDVSGSWFVQSYSFSKESMDQPAQETWSLIKYKDLDDFLTSQGVSSDRIAIPSGVTRGITMGESTEEDGVGTGIQFSSVFAQSQTGSVSAGGFGKVSFIYSGTVEAVGGGSSSAAFVGTGSASIPYTPLYI